MGKIKKYRDTGSDLDVIWHENFKFQILELVRPPTDPWLIPTTQNKKIEIWEKRLEPGVIWPDDFKFCIPDHVRLAIDHEHSQPTQNCKN